jgi:diphosphomevalonate decarboxylase
VHSRNDFPTGAGLASSASGFAALVTAAAAALELSMPVQELAAIARLGSGSAPRSLLGGVVLLTNEGDATRCEQLSAPADWPLHVVVAVTTSEKKEISSREGMAISARTSPFYPSWVESHAADLAAGRDSIRARDFTRLAELAEHNCLKMHAVMQSSRPPLVYWNPATVACLHAIRALRTAGVPVFFTIDAGPQVKAVCLPDARAQVTRELSAIPGVQRILQSPLGEGARLTSAGGSSA